MAAKKGMSWIWPKVIDLKTAKLANRQGVWAASFVAVVTAVFSALGAAGIQLFEFTFGAWSLIDACIFGVLSFGIYKMSRIASVAGLGLYLIERADIWITYGPKNLIIAGLLVLMFINSIRGTFAYHRMNLVIDNNQLSYCNRLFQAFPYVRIILPLPVYAEIILRFNPKESLEVLQGHHLLFGMEIYDIFSAVACLSEEGVYSFKPFLNMDRKEQACFEQSIFDPTIEFVSLARRIKNNNLQFCSDMRSNAVNFRKKKGDLKSSGSFKSKDQFEKLEDALESAPSFFEELIFDMITQGGKRPCIISSKAGLKDAVMSNPHLSRLFRSILCYIISISRMWINQKYNYDPDDGRDDLTDVLLPTYAHNGDIIVTNDKKLKRHIELLEPTGVVKGRSVQELLAK